MEKKKKIYKDFQDLLTDELQDQKLAVAYLNEALQDDDPAVFLLALKDVLCAQKKEIATVAQRANLNRQSVHRMLSKKGNPRWKNMNALFDSLGLQVHVSLKR